METVRESTFHVLEKGDVFFFYRPVADETSPHSLLDVRRFHVVLRPEGEERLRLLTIGRKRLPGSEASDEPDRDRNYWGFVERVFDDCEQLRTALGPASYQTATQGERFVPPARPAGEGVYTLARVGRNTILAYALELPHEPGEVQEAFRIEPRGHYVLAIKNPGVETPAGMGLEADRQADFPADLRQRFGNRRWVAADPPEFLDYEGAELLLIGGRIQGDLDADLELDPSPADEDDADLFQELQLERSGRIVKPLIEGEWE